MRSYCYQKKKEIKTLTETGLSHQRFGGFTGLRVACFIDSDNTELVFHVFDEIVDFARTLRARHFGSLLPHRTAQVEIILGLSVFLHEFFCVLIELRCIYLYLSRFSMM